MFPCEHACAHTCDFTVVTKGTYGTTQEDPLSPVDVEVWCSKSLHSVQASRVALSCGLNRLVGGKDALHWRPIIHTYIHTYQLHMTHCLLPQLLPTLAPSVACYLPCSYQLHYCLLLPFNGQLTWSFLAIAKRRYRAVDTVQVFPLGTYVNMKNSYKSDDCISRLLAYGLCSNGPPITYRHEIKVRPEIEVAASDRLL